MEPRDEILIKPQISGIIDEVYKEAGQAVKKGEVIAKVKVIPELGQLNSAESRVRLAEINATQAETDFARVKKLYEDQLDALERDSKRMGNAGDHIDYALLLDGLKAEREQGITIDVAYRYFSTNNRKFIIADTPGHEQYTRNMITGGSTANLAIILVDARTGVITQTRRHTCLLYTSPSPRD